MCAYNIYIFSINMINEVFTISFFLTNSQPLPLIQRNRHVEMNNYSCSSPCAWMTIMDSILCLWQLILRCFMGVVY